jgi:hypothetical protein
MFRFILSDLARWLKDKDKSPPLIIRGARQVGKTWTVRQLAEQLDLTLIELNLEKQPQLRSLFEINDVQVILQNIETLTGQSITPKNCLLFLDEIQAAPELLAKLRWFAEDRPQLAVIAASSLLEFTLEKHTFSMPVGRITYRYLGPLSFCEFLHALGHQKLSDLIQNSSHTTIIPEITHHKLLDLFNEYSIVGGLPAAVKDWAEHQSPNNILQIHHDLISTYQDDFNKYSGNINPAILQQVFDAIPHMLGRKFVYKHVNPDLPLIQIKNSLELLKKARICTPAVATSANGTPLGAEIKTQYFKVVSLDTGLASTLLGLRLDQFRKLKDINLINNGAIAEQVVGQLLQCTEPYYIEPNLYYWRREQPRSSAEIDYVIQHNSSIIPIEVKSGKTGTLKSLHLFMALKERKLAVRINADLLSRVEIDVTTQLNNQAKYELLSIPFYLTEVIHQLL